MKERAWVVMRGGMYLDVQAPLIRITRLDIWTPDFRSGIINSEHVAERLAQVTGGLAFRIQIEGEPTDGEQTA